MIIATTRCLGAGNFVPGGSAIVAVFVRASRSSRVDFARS
jgi:hypothetical protein